MNYRREKIKMQRYFARVARARASNPKVERPAYDGPKNGHAGDGLWVWCPGHRHNHMICQPRPEGCDFGTAKVANPFNEHLLNLRDGHKCWACGHEPKFWRLAVAWKDNHLEMQHILPRSKGGSNCLHNLIFLCAPCHRKLAKGRVYGGMPSRAKTYTLQPKGQEEQRET